METLDADALRRLYPEAFWEPFLAQGCRPDGRPVGQARPVSIGFGAVSNAVSSALVKMGNTAVLAACRLEIMQPLMDSCEEGALVVTFEMPPLCSPLAKPGRPTEDTHVTTHRLQSLLGSKLCIDPRQLCIIPKVAAWAIYLSVVCIDADGSVFDAALLSCVACLASLELPALRRSKDGRMVALPKEEAGEGAGAEIEARAAAAAAEKDLAAPRKRLILASIPIAQTIALHSSSVSDHSPQKQPQQERQHLLIDPGAEEERLGSGSIAASASASSSSSITLTVVLDAASLGPMHLPALPPKSTSAGPQQYSAATSASAAVAGVTGPTDLPVLGVFKAGGQVLASPSLLLDCIAAAGLNVRERFNVLRETLNSVLEHVDGERDSEQE